MLRANIKGVFLTLALSITLSCQAYGYGETPFSGKWLCVTEQKAGLEWDANKKRLIAHVYSITDDDKFVLTIQPIKRNPYEREFCQKNITYWGKILAEKGTFTEEDEKRMLDGRDSVDWRSHISHCFASELAHIQRFGNRPSFDYYSYDFSPNEFSGILGGVLSMGNDMDFFLEEGAGSFSVSNGKCAAINE